MMRSMEKARVLAWVPPELRTQGEEGGTIVSKEAEEAISRGRRTPKLGKSSPISPIKEEEEKEGNKKKNVMINLIN